MKTYFGLGCFCCAAILCIAPSSVMAFDWQAGPWGIEIASDGSPDSEPCPIFYPGGSASGRSLKIYYGLSPTNLPQFWVFLTDGFWRQTSAESQFLTSYRLFRYYSSANEDCDRLSAVQFIVQGTNAVGELLITTVYENHAVCGDRFQITGHAVLEIPSHVQADMRADLVVSNASGYAVSPLWQGHRALSEQWELLGVSSMYVADNLTGELPVWYSTLDPLHRYVGITGDSSYLNDGYSVNGELAVSTHDTKYIVTTNTIVSLDHDTQACPIVVVPNYTWYDQLVMQGVASSELRTQHAYCSARNHFVQILGCAGLTSNLQDLKWAATYNRLDTNMVDGDNIQIKLGMDEVLNAWPIDGVQRLSLRLVTGNTPPTITQFAAQPSGHVSLAWTTEPGESYALKYATSMNGSWSNIVTDITSGTIGPLSSPPGFFRIVEE